MTCELPFRGVTRFWNNDVTIYEVSVERRARSAALYRMMLHQLVAIGVGSAGTYESAAHKRRLNGADPSHQSCELMRKFMV